MQQRVGRTAVLFFVAAFLPVMRAHAQASFSTYVAFGDSLTAGFSNGSLVESHQSLSYPALLARQAGVSTFEQPLVSQPGIPTELTLVTLIPPVVAAKASNQGAPLRLDLPRPYNNLGVPGARVNDLLTRVTDVGTIGGTGGGSSGPGFHDLILRGKGTALAQGISLKPTTVTLWIGNNDVLAAAVAGRAIDGVTLTPLASFQASYQSVVDAIKGSGATTIVAANIPDVTTIPFVTTIRPIVVSPTTGAPVLVNGQTVALLGPTGPLPANSLVTLAAAPLLLKGDGIPTALGGTGRGLPDEVILDLNEVAVIRERVAQYNQVIATICQAAGIPVLDINAFLSDVAANGRTIGGVSLTSAYLSGGLFGYDGIHPTDLGYALIANQWIRLVNARGGQLEEVNLGPYLGVTATPAAASASGPRGVVAGGRAPWTAFTAEAYDALRAAFPMPSR
jgi:lysophospholipase L1-like esterase